MNLFKPKFRDRKTGQLVETPRWYCDFRDHRGTRQRFAADDEEDEAKVFGLMLGDLVRCRKRQVQPKDKLWTWLMGLEPDVKARLVKLDLADRRWFVELCQGERLSEWVNDYEAWLRNSKGRNGYHRNKTYIEVTLTRIRNIVRGCGFRAWADIRITAVETYLGGLSVKIGTHDGYIGAFKQFCKWCVRDGRAEFSPVQYLDRVRDPDNDKRQALSFDQVGRLLAAAANGPEVEGIGGMERAVLYRVAIETGFRANELRQLKVGSFDLEKATVKLDARHCKDRRDATQPITLALAGHLGDYLADKDPMDPAFNLKTRRTAQMLQADSAEAGLPLVDDKGRKLVFHSLRHTLRDELRKARVTESVIDQIMRHKPTGVGQRFYTHITEFEIREAIERLPEYPWPGDVQAQAQKAVS